MSDPTAVPPGPGKSDFDSDLSVEGIRTDCWNWGKGFISAYRFFVKINGKNEKVKAVPGSYLTINRKWKDGDTV